jgi:hypothetical protein
MNYSPQLEILKEATDFLGNLAKESGEKFSTDKGKDIRRSFINRHAWNVHDIATDVLTLGKYGDLRSIHLLSRPALESLFKLAAAVMTPSFAAEKVIAEIKDEQKKLNKWSKARPVWSQNLKQVEAGLKQYEDELRKNYNVSSSSEWNTFDTAVAGKLDAEYVGDYFLGSLHVHATLRALVDREDALYISAGICGLTMTVAHASALLSNVIRQKFWKSHQTSANERKSLSVKSKSWKARQNEKSTGRR